MLSCCGAVCDDSELVGTGLGGLITLLLLDDVGIVQGACAETAFNEQVMQVDQGCDCNARCANLHAGADERVQHPRREQCHHARRHLYVDDWTRGVLLIAAKLDTTPVQRMPAVMNFNFLPDMGGMTGQLPSGAEIGSLPAPSAPAVVLPRSKACWPRPSSTDWSPMPGSRPPWKNCRPGPTAASTSCCRSGPYQLNSPVRNVVP